MPYEINAVGGATPTAKVALANQPLTETYHKCALKSTIEKKIWHCLGHDLAMLRCLLEVSP
jgi:hypothetical protein